MKNTCKRLFSLMLAVVLLVSVVPFQASAVERTDPCFIDVLDIGENGYYRMELEEGYLSAAAVDYIKVVAIQKGIPAVLDIPGVGEMKIDDLQYYDFTAHGVFEGAYKYPEGYGINATMPGLNDAGKEPVVENTVSVKIVWQADNKAVAGGDKQDITIAGTEPTWSDVANLLPANCEKIDIQKVGDNYWKFIVAPKAEAPTITKIDVKVVWQDSNKAVPGGDKQTIEIKGTEPAWSDVANLLPDGCKKIDKIEVEPGYWKFIVAPKAAELTKVSVKVVWEADNKAVPGGDKQTIEIEGKEPTWADVANLLPENCKKIEKTEVESGYWKFVVAPTSDHNGQVKEHKLTFQVKYNGTIYTATNLYQDGKTVELKKDFVKDMIGKAYDSYNENRSAYSFEGETHNVNDKVYMNGDKIVTFKLTKNSNTTSKDKHDVILNIYTWDGIKASSAELSMSKSIGGKDHLAWDGDLEWDELKQYVRKYYSAKDADGIDYDGMYIENGSNMMNWLKDENKYDDGIFDLDARRAKNTVNISVFISNATKKSTNNSDNPKTGDEIFMTVSIMAISATALAGAYVFNKKRMVK